ncbi:unnamed protein product [Bemisia tabaci]|uniref:Uncharacterized protein n=1 Tax=Bemisia tabaci TaxID=7038 RepID=A0AAI8UUJ7_BEMTA|nr:unnamed protein product [Bemisia tabaci]
MPNLSLNAHAQQRKIRDEPLGQSNVGYQNQPSYNIDNSATSNGNSGGYSEAYLTTYDVSSSTCQQNRDISSLPIVPSCVFDESQVKDSSGSQSGRGYQYQPSYNINNSATSSRKLSIESIEARIVSLMTYDEISSTSQQNHDTLSLPLTSSCAFNDFQVKDSSSSQCCRGYQNQSSYKSGNSAILNGNSSCYGGACLATYDGSSSSSKANHNVSSSSLIPSCAFDESQVKSQEDSMDLAEP